MKMPTYAQSHGKLKGAAVPRVKMNANPPTVSPSTAPQQDNLRNPPPAATSPRFAPQRGFQKKEK